MPLYMDFHKIAGLTIEEVRKAHLADLAIQEKYGVKYHQFWLNQQAGTIFCLTEGPDMKTCEMVHRLAHGNVACAMTEVEPGYYNIFMGKEHRVDHGIVQHPDGSPDLGYRSILVVDVQPRRTTKGAANGRGTEDTFKSTKFIAEKIVEFGGRQTKWGTADALVGIFNDLALALRCAKAVRHEIVSSDLPLLLRIGLSVGQPVTENGEFFTTALRLGHRLRDMAVDNEVVISSLARALSDDDQLRSEYPFVRSLNASDEDFVSKLLAIVEANLANEQFRVSSLCYDLGVSRPQLYRKITSLSGRSPNDLLRDLRLDRAATLLKRKTGNISEIALEAGYASPSYFARRFAGRFGCTPSEFLQALSHEGAAA